MNIKFSTNPLKVIELFNFLKQCDKQFIPQLSYRVDLLEYTQKLILKSTIIHAHFNNKIIGLIAFYANKPELHYAYISLICVLQQYEGQKVGKKLIEKCILRIKAKGFKLLNLEVNSENSHAIEFYLKKGFKITRIELHSLYMTKSL